VALGALVAVSSGFVVAGPVVVRTIVDRAVDGTTTAEVVRLSLLFLALAIAAQLLAVVVAWFATITAWRTTNELRVRLARHVLGLDHEFHRRHTPGELIQRIDGDVTSVSDFFGIVMPKALGAAFLVVGVLAVLTVVDWRVAIGALLYVAVAATVVVASRHAAVEESADEMGSYAALYGGIEERLTAGEDLRANGAGAHAMWRFVEESTEALASSVRRESAFLRMWWGAQGSLAGGMALTLVSSAVLLERGIITIGTAFLMFQFVLLLQRPLEDLVEQLETVQKANGAMVRVLSLSAITSRIVDDGTTAPPPGALSIELDHVGFHYDDDEPVLRDVTLHIAAGRSVGVVGRTGSGKTTASRLLTRLVEATDGVVRLGGVAIADIPLDELRRRVAVIPQEVELFHGSVRDNVTMFDDGPSDQQVMAALRAVGLHDLATNDLHRPLGAGGAGLSAGQSQLLALARVWLRQPDLMVLDEATARVDPATEQLLEQAITALMHGRTTVIIAHRLSTLRHVDEIVVFEHGRVVEHGGRELLAADTTSRWAQLLDVALEPMEQR
jgi:ABC-type multidrug transport system fused ATPase/permease subunit